MTTAKLNQQQSVSTEDSNYNYSYTANSSVIYKTATKANLTNSTGNELVGDIHTFHSADYYERDAFNKDDHQETQIVNSETPQTKLTKLDTTTIPSKRVSFGSSRCSMVETLFFEAPTPISEEVESSHLDVDSSCPNDVQSAFLRNSPMDKDLFMKDELSSTALRVCIYQSSEPQIIRVPEFLSECKSDFGLPFIVCDSDIADIMATSESTIPDYKLAQSADSGWDNPFRPDGELSREADEIVKLISGGKAITPTCHRGLENGLTDKENPSYNAAFPESVCKTNMTPVMTGKDRLQETILKPLAQQHDGAQSLDSSKAAPVKISNQVLPGPTSASHVVIGEKKTKKRACCTLQ